MPTELAPATTAENYLILFGDLIGSTEVASEALPSDFAQFYVASFQWAARKAYEFITIDSPFPGQQFKRHLSKPRVQGDEALSFTRLDEMSDEEQTHCVASAVAFAYVLKVMWLASPYNVRRLADKQFARDIAIGLHIGPAGSVPMPDTDVAQIAGLHINIAKRIQTDASLGSESRIFASSDVVNLFDNWCKPHSFLPVEQRSPILMSEFVKRRDLSDLKGLPRRVQLYELVSTPDILEQADKSLMELIKTPEKANVLAEKVAAVWAHTFLPPETPAFTCITGESVQAMVIHPNGVQFHIDEYVRRWFGALERPARLFFGEQWLLMSAFFVSVSLARHQDVLVLARRGDYSEACGNILTLIKSFAAKAREK